MAGGIVSMMWCRWWALSLGESNIESDTKRAAPLVCKPERVASRVSERESPTVTVREESEIPQSIKKSEVKE